MTRRGLTMGPLVAGLLLLSACGAPEARTLPPPSSTSSTEPAPTTTEPDYSLIALEPVPGRAVPTTPITEGSATLRGSVQGPDGPVPDAVVRADRLIRHEDGDVVQRAEARTGPDGTFTLGGIPGGRFRVRAFLPPTFAMESAEVFFLRDGEERELRLVVEAFTGLTVGADSSPASPIVGQGVNLAVRVAQRTVDGDGVAREVPQAGVMVRVDASGWTPLGPNPLQTDGNGVAVFEFQCDAVGTVSATALVGPEQQAFPLEPPPCRPVPTTTTTTTTTSSVPADEDDDDDDDTDSEG